MGGSSFDQGRGVAVDAGGNVYTTGHFRGTVDFDPGAGVTNLISAGSEDVFVQKLDAAVTGTISGNVSANSSNLAGVTVKLLEDANPSNVVDDQLTDSNGDYSFTDVPVDVYQVMIVEPLGYTVDQNDVFTILNSGDNLTIDFVLTEIVLVNNARSKGYWKHQFDVYVKNRGHAQESAADLLSYIDEVSDRYRPHFSIFDDATDGTDDFEDWQAILSVKGNAGMEAKATAQLAALVLNIMSLKVGQYEVVTADNKTAGDVMTYVSELIEDGDGSNDELAKDLADAVNLQQTIAAGLVNPGQNILYKINSDLNFEIPESYTLYQNHPNPFNPTTIIGFTLPESGFVTLSIYNSLGEEVAVLVNHQMAAGSFNIPFDASGFPSGIYLYRIIANNFVSVKKMILLK